MSPELAFRRSHDDAASVDDEERLPPLIVIGKGSFACPTSLCPLGDERVQGSSFYASGGRRERKRPFSRLGRKREVQSNMWRVFAYR